MDEFDAEWVIVGCRDKYDLGVILLTSRDLTRTQLEERLKTVGRRSDPGKAALLTCELGSHLQVFAASYPEGMMALAERWPDVPGVAAASWLVVE